VYSPHFILRAIIASFVPLWLNFAPRLDRRVFWYRCDRPTQTSLDIFDFYYRDGSCYDVARIALEQRGLYRLIQCPP
jgi:hypothetical protein